MINILAKRREGTAWISFTSRKSKSQNRLGYCHLHLLLVLQIVAADFFSCLSDALTLEGEALLAFKSGSQDSRGVLESWREADADPCQWKGVVCNRHKQVVSLNLPYNHLWGSISPALGELRHLRRLSLHENNLFGNLPPELANCSKLKAVYLQDNFLSGRIPDEIGSLVNLLVLDISGNALTGEIPPSLGNLKKLKRLNISMNFLVGKIPQTGVLTSFSNASFIGNLGLCGSQVGTICKPEVSSPSVASANSDDSNATNVPVTSKPASSYMDSLFIGAMVTMGVSFAFLLTCFWGYYFYSKGFSKDEIIKPLVLEDQSKTKFHVFHGDLPFASQRIVKKLEMLNETDMIGRGGFGTVYKLAMDDGTLLAIKLMEKNGKFCERIFARELEILGVLRHRHLVNLRGYCTATSMNLLIYDFLPNGSLENLLHGSMGGFPILSWSSRVKIAVGTAKGLSYLHHDCSPTVLHRDIKSSNILLDDELEPHVADFGLAKLMPDHTQSEQANNVTTVLAGTFGYLAPEYMQNGIATTKTDVYSYGVLFLELISGRRPTDQITAGEKSLNLVGWAEQMVKQKQQKQVLDRRCQEELQAEVTTESSFEAMLCIALACVSACPEERPPMNRVVQMLEVETMSPSIRHLYDSASD